MENNELKRIFFIAVTDEPESNNRKYSDFVYEMCYHKIDRDSKLKKMIDFNAFLRHDMKTAANIKKSLYECLNSSDIYSTS